MNEILVSYTFVILRAGVEGRVYFSVFLSEMFVNIKFVVL